MVLGDLTGGAALRIPALGTSEQGSPGEKDPGREAGTGRADLRVVVYRTLRNVHGATRPGQTEVAVNPAAFQMSASLLLFDAPRFWAHPHPVADLAAPDDPGVRERAGVVSAADTTGED